MTQFDETPRAWDEASRMEALRALKLLDTPGEERFDRVTRMAKDVLKVPIALISLVDSHRQWFKSRPDFDVAETPRAISFCAHAILQDGVFIVEDTLTDPRFADNPMVVGSPFIRFYAGNPLYSSDGKKVGTLCLIDRVPRKLDDAERAKLRSLAGWAEREVNLFSADADALLRLENKLRLAHLLEYAVDGMISAHIDGTIETANPAACEIFRFTAVELIGRNIRQLVPPREHSMHMRFMAHLREGTPGDARTGLEVIGVRKGGEEFPLEVSFRMLETHERKFFTGIVRDITERKNLERLKSEFVASVSHELRTPLTSISGALGMLKEEFAGPLPDTMRQLIEIAYSNAQRLNALVNDILDVEKLDAGMMEFSRETCAVQDLIDEACRLNGPFAKKLNVMLQAQVPRQPIFLNIDRSRFIQVLTNLISNACKFSPPDKMVGIAVAQHESWLRINVIDQGPGIADELRTTIFQRFMQGQPARDYGKTGTGLGLSLSKSMVEKMGGRIGYDSVIGQGATFFIEFPVAR